MKNCWKLSFYIYVKCKFVVLYISNKFVVKMFLEIGIFVKWGMN